VRSAVADHAGVDARLAEHGLLVVRQHVHHARGAKAEALAAKALGRKAGLSAEAVLLHERRHGHLLLLLLLLREEHGARRGLLQGAMGATHHGQAHRLQDTGSLGWLMHATSSGVAQAALQGCPPAAAQAGSSLGTAVP
jgi:hypothetical protein